MFKFFKKKSDSDLLGEVIEEDRKEKMRQAYKLGQEVSNRISDEINLFFENRVEVVFQRYIEILGKTLSSEINDRSWIKNDKENRMVTVQEIAQIELEVFLENAEKALSDLGIELIKKKVSNLDTRH